jgi:hypothetical protein
VPALQHPGSIPVGVLVAGIPAETLYINFPHAKLLFDLSSNHIWFREQSWIMTCAFAGLGLMPSKLNQAPLVALLRRVSLQ